MSNRDPKEPVSVRLPADLVAALRQKASDDGSTLSDVLRQGALGMLGICPTCEQPVPSRAPAGSEPAPEDPPVTPQQRDVASTTSTSTERTWQPAHRAPASARAFGFSKDVTA